MAKCNHHQPIPLMGFMCELEAGHEGWHQSSTVALGEFVRWPPDAERFSDALADLAKIK
jgi:hypothetical protein